MILDEKGIIAKKIITIVLQMNAILLTTTIPLTIQNSTEYRSSIHLDNTRVNLYNATKH